MMRNLSLVAVALAAVPSKAQRAAAAPDGLGPHSRRTPTRRGDPSGHTRGARISRITRMSCAPGGPPSGAVWTGHDIGFKSAGSSNPGWPYFAPVAGSAATGSVVWPIS